MSQETLFTKSALAIATAIISTQAWSASFQLNEFSSFGLNRAYSGRDAIVDDTGNTSRNPVLVMMLDRPTFSVGAIFVDPDVDISGRSRIGGDASQDSVAPTAWILNVHSVVPINDQFGWGASVIFNYGLATEFNNNYIAGLMGGKIDLETLNLNLSGVYRLNNHFSFGLGLSAAYAKAKLERYAGDLPQQIIAGSGGRIPLSLAAQCPADTQVVCLKGDEWGLGWNAGFLCEVDKDNRYGSAYRSEVKIDFNSDYRGNLPSMDRIPAQLRPVLANLPAGTDDSTIDGSLDLNLPEMWEFSDCSRVAPRWTVHYSMAYTSWSQFQELKAKGNNGQTLFYKEEDFKDSYRIALGTIYYYDNTWTFRTGIVFDDSPVPVSRRSISAPDQDRFWPSVGTTYAFNKDASLDVGISYIHDWKVKFEEGPYSFESEGRAWLYGMNLNYAS